MAQLDTNEGQGNGESFIRQWTAQNKLSKFTEIFIEMELSIDELLFLAVRPQELEDFCKEHSIKNIHKKRFEDAVKKLVSTHSKQDNTNQNQQVIVATLSIEEEEIINKVNTSHKKNKQKKDKIHKLVNDINNKEKQCTNNINLAFNELHKALDNRKTKLLQDLDKISTEKKNKLISTEQKITQVDTKIKSFQTNCNALLLDWKMDKTKRKQQIIAAGGNIINDKSLTIEINDNINIEFKCDQNKVNTFVSTFGFVDGIGVPDAPGIEIKEVYENSVKIAGNFEDKYGVIECLEVNVAEFEGNYENDMKLEWRSEQFEVKEINEEYELKQLKSECNYVVKAKCKSERGWSWNGVVKTFKTKDELKFMLYNNEHFVVSNNGKIIKGKGSRCCASTAYIGNGYNSGIHTCQIKNIGQSYCSQVVGVYCGPRRTQSTHGQHHYFRSHATYYKEYRGHPKTAGEVVKVVLDCNNWNVTFFLNNKQQKQEDIQRNQIYYFALDSCGGASSCNYEIVS